MKHTGRTLGILIYAVICASTALAQPANAPADSPQSDEPDLYSRSATAQPGSALVWKPPSTLDLFIFVVDVDSVNSANQNFAASVYYVARWNNPALRHEDPDPITRSASEIWAPHLTIVNQQQSWAAFPNSVQILPNGDIVMRQKVWGWFSQPLDLRNFPFDQQTLTIHLAAADLAASDVTVQPLTGEQGQKSGIAKRFSLPDFEVLSFKAEPQPYIAYAGQRGVAGFVMEIRLKRGVEYYLWKLIIPICLIVMMSWIPRWIDPKEMSINIGISTTSFLTLVAYLFAVAHLLPPVSYFTRMDEFILLSMVIVFIGLVQTVIVSVMTIRNARTKLTVRFESWSRPVYLVGLGAILAMSFGW
jgi:hypothetical protein